MREHFKDIDRPYKARCGHIGCNGFFDEEKRVCRYCGDYTLGIVALISINC